MIRLPKEEIAWAVRLAFEQFRKHPRYGDGWDESLAGCCYTASFVLKELLISEGHNALIGMGCFESDLKRNKKNVGLLDHAWVESGRQVFDITATQFDIPHRVYLPKGDEAKKYYPLLLGKRAEAQYHDHWYLLEPKESRFMFSMARRFLSRTRMIARRIPSITMLKSPIFQRLGNTEWVAGMKRQFEELQRAS